MGATRNHITNRIETKLGVNADGDLQVCFGSTQMSLMWFFIDNAAAINKWARFRWFPHPNGEFYNDHYDDQNSDRLAAAASVNYGLTAPAAQQNFASTFGNSWGCAVCTASDPMESWDFEGYNGEALPPVDTIGNIDAYLSSGSGFSFTSYIRHQPSGGDTITWADLPASVGNYYLCVIFSKTSDFSGALLAKTSTQAISDNGLALDITQAELEQLYNGGYKYYYLVARSAQLSGLQDPAANSAYYLGLPSANNTNDVKGNFTIHAAAVASVLIVGVNRSQTPGSAARFLSASPYIGPESFPAVETDYFSYVPGSTPPPPPYYIHFKLEVTAGSAAFTVGTPKVALSQTFFSGAGFSTPVLCDLYDDGYNQVSQVTVPAGTTKIVYLVAPSALFSLDASGSQQSGAAPDQYFSAIVRFYNGNVLMDQSNEFRVRNYSF